MKHAKKYVEGKDLFCYKWWFGQKVGTLETRRTEEMFFWTNFPLYGTDDKTRHEDNKIISTFLHLAIDLLLKTLKDPHLYWKLLKHAWLKQLQNSF